MVPQPLKSAITVASRIKTHVSFRTLVITVEDSPVRREILRSRFRRLPGSVRLIDRWRFFIAASCNFCCIAKANGYSGAIAGPSDHVDSRGDWLVCGERDSLLFQKAVNNVRMFFSQQPLIQSAENGGFI
jgi:hypothetical protein